MEPRPFPSGRPALRLVDRERAAPAGRASSSGAWIALFGALAAAGGHGLFLVTALTRLAKLPGRAELGGALEIAVLAWFALAAPLALACVALRGVLLPLPARTAWSLALAVAGVTAAAFALYLRAVALA
jgi:hypothetical protein